MSARKSVGAAERTRKAVLRRKRYRLTLPHGFVSRLAKLGYRIRRQKLAYHHEAPPVWLIVAEKDLQRRGGHSLGDSEFSAEMRAIASLFSVAALEG